MKKLILFIFFQTFLMAGFSQELLLDKWGAPIQRTNIVVRWKAPKPSWPKNLWTYRVVPTQFSPTVVSNMIALGNFINQDRSFFSTNGMYYSKEGRSLRISFIEGQIEYDGAYKSWQTNHVNLPETNQLFQLTTNFLPTIGINLSEIAKNENGKFDIERVNDLGSMYMEGDVWTTNITGYEVWFRRALDGVRYRGDGGEGQITFGEHGQVEHIRLSWRSVEYDKLYPAATPRNIIEWIHEGKAIFPHNYDAQGNLINIDWAGAKSITIKKATAYYWSDLFFQREVDHQPILPCWVLPYVILSTTVDADHNNVDVEIDCPIIDETKQ
jgi:hypothetical protein